MKLKEFKLLKEEFTPEANTNISIDVKFTHEQGLEDVFGQLQNLPTFKKDLETKFCRMYETLIQEYIHKSSVPPGTGWTDDYECTADIIAQRTNTVINQVDEGLNKKTKTVN